MSGYANLFSGASQHLKNSAQKKFQRAVKNGKIERGCCCECGAPNALGHHEDYAKPFDVIWLCPLHHRWRHKYGYEYGLEKAAA